MVESMEFWLAVTAKLLLLLITTFNFKLITFNFFFFNNLTSRSEENVAILEILVTVFMSLYLHIPYQQCSDEQIYRLLSAKMTTSARFIEIISEVTMLMCEMLWNL